MKKFLSCIVAVAAFAVMAGKLPVLSYSFKEKTEPNEKKPGIHDDPGFRKLTDGKINYDKSKKRYGSVKFRHVLNGGKAPTIRFNFKTPVKLSSAKIHYFRWKTSHGIKSIRLRGIKADGTAVPMGELALNHPYRKPDNEPFNAAAEVRAADNTPVKSVEVIFVASGGWLSLNEVEFFGEAVKETAAAPAIISNPLDKFASAARPGFRMYRDDGQFILENDLVIYAIDPGYSGAVSYAYDKIAKSNVIQYSARGSGSGPFFNDRFYPGDYDVRDMYRYISYKAEVIADTPEKKQVKMTGTGKSGVYANVKIEKLYTLEKSSRTLKVDYNITNGMENVVPFLKGFWTYGSVQYPGSFSHVAPGLYGVEVTPAVSRAMLRDVSDNWYATQDSSNGLAVLAPWTRMKEVCFWMLSPYSCTMECKMGQYPIKAGESLNFEMGLVPYSRIGTPDKVTELAAGGFNLATEYSETPKRLSFKLQLNKKFSGTLRISCGVMQNGKVDLKPIASRKISENYTEFSFAPPVRKGTMVLRAELLKDGKVVYFADASAVCGGRNTGLYSQILPGEKLKDIGGGEAKLNLNFNSTAFATPHIKWAKPCAAGKLRVLAINTANGGIRDMIEMAQRFDIDLTTNFIGGIWMLSGHTMSLNVKACANELTRQLKKDYDLIMVAGCAWEYIGSGNADIILNKVRAGTGLMLIGPENLPAALKKFVVPANSSVRKSQVWQGDFAGIAPELLPPTRVIAYKKFGTVDAKAGKYPLSGNFKLGKGNVQALSWLVSPAGNKKRLPSSFFLPLMSYSTVAVPEFDYHEYQMAYLAKLMYRTAGKRFPLTDGAFTAVNGRGTLKITSAKAESLEANLVVRDRFSRKVSEKRIVLKLKKGVNQIDLPLEKSNFNGMHIVDLQLSGKQGTLWWGAAVFANKAAGQLNEVKFAKKVYRKEETLAVETSFAGTGSVLYRLMDIYGNEVARSEGAEAGIQLADCRTPVGFLITTLEKDGKVIDECRNRIEFYQPPAPHRFNLVQGWPSVGQRSQLAFIPYYLDQLKQYGITATSGSGSSRDEMSVEREFRNRGITYISSAVHMAGGGIGGKRPWNMKKKAVSKFDMIRIPCLSTPGYKEKLGKISGYGFNYALGAMIIPGPDEANMFSDWDGCFSPHCQKEFRRYLQKIYPSLEALNRSWDTDFSAWDEVVALTSAEVRKKRSFAGWLDHRTFMDWNRADAFRIMITAMDKTGLMYSLSGTSETNPWNAWDFYRLMPYLRSLASYSGEQTIQHRSFAPHRVASMPWIGYDQSYNGSHYKVIYNLMNGATGFNIYGNFNIAPDFQLSKMGRELIRVLNMYRNGTGEAIMHMNTKTYPIAFHYTPASIKLDWILGLDNQRKTSTTGFRQLVGDAGLAYDYLAYGELEKNGVPDKYKIVFLPMSAALSDREAAALEKFVASGGTLIADFLCGTYDEHGKKRDVPALNKVFGIKSAGQWEKRPVTLEGCSRLKGLTIRTDYVETGVQPVSAEVLATIDGKPAAFENRYGKGRAIYFASSAISSFGNWAEMRYAGNNIASNKLLGEFFSSICSEYGIAPFVTAPTLRGTSLLLREKGDAVILATLRDVAQNAILGGKESQKHRINLAAERHVYDLLQRRYIGYGKSFVYEYAPDTQGVFALLPYRGKDIEIAFTPEGAELKLIADADRLAEHTFHVELLDENGKENPAFNEVIQAPGGKVLYKFRKPLNAKGQWKLKVREILTGVSRTVDLP